MKQLLKSKKELVLLGIVLFAHLVLLSTQSIHAQTTPLLRSWSMEVVAPFLKQIVGSLTSVSRVWYGYVDLRNAREDNLVLRSQVAEYRQALLDYEEKIRQVSRLGILAQLQETLQIPSVPARIIGGDANQWYKSRIIDQGLAAGVTKDCTVVNADGVVGRVVHVSEKGAVIQLITDVDSGVGVLLESSRAQGVFKGMGNREGLVEYIGTNETVTVGEKILTSGLDQIYPKGLLLGHAIGVAPARQIFQRIEVGVSADMQKLEEVLVLKRKPNS